MLEAIKLLKRLRKVKAALEKCLRPPFNYVEARKAVVKCEQIGYIQDHTPYSDVVRLAASLERTHEMLEEAKDSWDEDKLERAIAEASKTLYHRASSSKWRQQSLLEMWFAPKVAPKHPQVLGAKHASNPGFIHSTPLYVMIGVHRPKSRSSEATRTSAAWQTSAASPCSACCS